MKLTESDVMCGIQFARGAAKRNNRDYERTCHDTLVFLLGLLNKRNGSYIWEVFLEVRKDLVRQGL